MARKNKEVEVEIEEINEEIEIEVTVGSADNNVYTYVGTGDTPPAVINFMGRQEFVRGEPVEVVDEAILPKLQNNPSFIKGTVEMRELHARDKAAAHEAAEKRQADALVQQNYARKHSGSDD